MGLEDLERMIRTLSETELQQMITLTIRIRTEAFEKMRTSAEENLLMGGLNYVI